MFRLRHLLAVAIVAVALPAAARAQVVVYSPYMRPVVPHVAYAPPVPVVQVAPVAPVVSAYRPAVTTYVAPAATVRAYSTYRPVVPAYAAPIVPVSPRYYRPAVVGPGIGGFPNLYRPGQPVRNALRFAIP